MTFKTEVVCSNKLPESLSLIVLLSRLAAVRSVHFLTGVFIFLKRHLRFFANASNASDQLHRRFVRWSGLKALRQCPPCLSVNFFFEKNYHLNVKTIIAIKNTTYN